MTKWESSGSDSTGKKDPDWTPSSQLVVDKMYQKNLRKRRKPSGTPEPHCSYSGEPEAKKIKLKELERKIMETKKRLLQTSSEEEFDQEIKRRKKNKKKFTEREQKKESKKNFEEPVPVIIISSDSSDNESRKFQDSEGLQNSKVPTLVIDQVNSTPTFEPVNQPSTSSVSDSFRHSEDVRRESEVEGKKTIKEKKESVPQKIKKKTKLERPKAIAQKFFYLFFYVILFVLVVVSFITPQVKSLIQFYLDLSGYKL